MRVPRRFDDADWSLPVHIKQVSRLNWTRLLERASELDDTLHTRLKLLEQWCFFPGSCTNAKKFLPSNGQLLQAKIPQDVFSQLASFGYVRRPDFAAHEATSSVCIFPVVEMVMVDGIKRYRLRIIFWPEQVNEEIQSMPFDIMLPTMDDLTKSIGDEGAVTIDAPAWYTQYQLPPLSRDYCFYYDNVLWQCATLPTGHRLAAHLAQTTLRVIAHLAQLPQFGPVTQETVCNLYIDNGRFLGNAASATTLANAFINAAKSMDMTFDITKECSTVVVFLGIEYNHREGWFRISDKTLAKLCESMDKVLGTGSSPSFRDVLRLFSQLQWCSIALKIHLCQFYFIYKYLRRRGKQLKYIDEPANIWPSIIPTLHRWCALCRTTRTSPRAPPTLPSAWLFTDACLTGWGAVLFYAGHRIIVSGAFKHHEEIHILEARALVYALALTSSMLQQFNISVLHIRIDNTSVIGAAKNTRSRNFTLNKLIWQFLVASQGWHIDIGYVRSKDNYADGPSRSFL